MPWAEGYHPLRVTARLSSGLAHADPWGITLDGILASQVHARSKRPGESDVMDLDAPPVLKLPLARCGAGDTWHWAATYSWPVDGHAQRPDVQYWMSAADHRDLEILATSMPRTVSDQRGRYRRHHMPLLVTVCSAVTWTALGDVDAIEDLLDGIRAIGKKRAAGNGAVMSWTVAPALELDSWTAGHLHPDGSLGRAAPDSCLTGRDVVTAGVSVTGIRPPYMHPASHTLAHLPTHPAA